MNQKHVFDLVKVYCNVVLFFHLARMLLDWQFAPFTLVGNLVCSVSFSLLTDQIESHSRTSLCLRLIAAFEITIDHPHTHVVKCTQLVRGELRLLSVAPCISVINRSALIKHSAIQMFTVRF